MIGRSIGFERGSQKARTADFSTLTVKVARVYLKFQFNFFNFTLKRLSYVSTCENNKKIRVLRSYFFCEDLPEISHFVRFRRAKL